MFLQLIIYTYFILFTTYLRLESNKKMISAALNTIFTALIVSMISKYIPRLTFWAMLFVTFQAKIIWRVLLIPIQSTTIGINKVKFNSPEDNQIPIYSVTFTFLYVIIISSQPCNLKYTSEITPCPKVSNTLGRFSQFCNFNCRCFIGGPGDFDNNPLDTFTTVSVSPLQ